MKTLINHIEYLLTQRDCVVVPSFGGFVVQTQHARYDEHNQLLAPVVSLAFNIELQHDDGILAQSYCFLNQLSYEQAMRLIAQQVAALKAELDIEQEVDFGALGVFRLENGKQVFYPYSDSLFHPSLPQPAIEMLPLDKIHELARLTDQSRKTSKLQRFIGASVASAAAVAIFFGTSTPIGNNNGSKFQTAGFISGINNSETETDAVDAGDIETLKPKYFIIVAGTKGSLETEKKLAKLKSEGFGEAGYLPSAVRNRIYVATFDSQEEADIYLKTFTARFPKYNDAWVYSPDTY